MEENIFENDLCLEIADFSGDGYIKYPVYNNKYYKEYYMDNKDEIIPFTTYYLEALSLCINFNGKKDLFDNLIDYYNKAFYFCDEKNQAEISKYVKESSTELKRIIIKNELLYRNDDLNFNLDFSSLSLKMKNIFKNEDFSFLSKNIKSCCVAIAMPTSRCLYDSSNCYLAISGVAKDNVGGILPNPIFKDVAFAYKEINCLLKSIYGFYFKECHFIDDVKRYTYLNSGKVLKKPIKFSTDYTKYSSNIFKFYSCCERKILAHMGFINMDYSKLAAKQKVVNKLTAYQFRIRYEPCIKCRPALIGCYSILFDSNQLNTLCTGCIMKGKTIKINSRTSSKEPLIVE